MKVMQFLNDTAYLILKESKSTFPAAYVQILVFDMVDVKIYENWSSPQIVNTKLRVDRCVFFPIGHNVQLPSYITLKLFAIRVKQLFGPLVTGFCSN